MKWLLIWFWLLLLPVGGWAKNSNLVITTAPRNARIYINNKMYKPPLKIWMSSGKITVFAAADGYDQYRKDVMIKTGDVTSLHIRMIKEDQANIPKEGAPMGPLAQCQIQGLPYTTAHFTVRWDNSYRKYLIVPNIPFDNQHAPQYFFKKYWKQYRAYGVEALRWMRSKKINPTNKVIWWEQEFWPKGAKAPKG